MLLLNPLLSISATEEISSGMTILFFAISFSIDLTLITYLSHIFPSFFLKSDNFFKKFLWVQLEISFTLSLCFEISSGFALNLTKENLLRSMLVSASLLLLITDEVLLNENLL